MEKVFFPHDKERHSLSYSGPSAHLMIRNPLHQSCFLNTAAVVVVPRFLHILYINAWRFLFFLRNPLHVNGLSHAK